MCSKLLTTFTAGSGNYTNIPQIGKLSKVLTYPAAYSWVSIKLQSRVYSKSKQTYLVNLEGLYTNITSTLSGDIVTTTHAHIPLKRSISL